MSDEQPTPREALLHLHEELSKKARALMRRKNEDYGRAQDPLFNFRRHGLKGMLVRMDDKLCRLDNYLDKGNFSVEDEGLEDTLLDMINYSVLFAYWVSLERSNASTRPGPTS